MCRFTNRIQLYRCYHHVTSARASESLRAYGRGHGRPRCGLPTAQRAAYGPAHARCRLRRPARTCRGARRGRGGNELDILELATFKNKSLGLAAPKIASSSLPPSAAPRRAHKRQSPGARQSMYMMNAAFGNARRGANAVRFYLLHIGG